MMNEKLLLGASTLGAGKTRIGRTSGAPTTVKRRRSTGSEKAMLNVIVAEAVANAGLITVPSGMMLGASVSSVIEAVVLVEARPFSSEKMANTLRGQLSDPMQVS